MPWLANVLQLLQETLELAQDLIDKVHSCLILVTIVTHFTTCSIDLVASSNCQMNVCTITYTLLCACLRQEANACLVSNSQSPRYQLA